MIFEIRTAGPADVPALRDLFRRSSLSNAGDRDNLQGNPEVLELPDAAVLQGRTRVAVDADGRILGFATSLPAGEAIEVEDLFVDPQWMRQGIGRALMRDMIDTARQGGAGRIEVTANPHALAFYGAVGFVFDHMVETRFEAAPLLRLELR